MKYLLDLCIGGLFLLGAMLFWNQMNKTEVPALVPSSSPQLNTSVTDPGDAGKVTLAGIDINNNGVRDDVEVYIETNVKDSARHRAALMSVAAVTQKEILAETKEEAVQVAVAGVRSIECLSYLGLRDQGRWREIDALMVNTEARLKAMDVHNDRIDGEVFQSLPDSQRRSACTFDVESLPN